MEDNTVLFEGEYLKGKKRNGKGYDMKGNLVYELTNGKGHIKEYESSDNYLKYEYDFLNGEKMEKEKYIITKEKLFLMENIETIKKVDMVKNIIMKQVN